MLDREINPPETYLKEIEEQKVYRCSCCNDPALYNELFELGIVTYGLQKDSLVCDFCLNSLHDNLTLTN